ncbi:MAG: paraquat-inducible protein A [Methylococcales bacterium]|nr:paraquat-inducible protein A [Methylococcales bacterium]
MKKHIPIALFILSVIALIPGITQPLMSVKATINKQEMLNLATSVLVPSTEQGNGFVQSMLQTIMQQLSLEGSVQVFESTRSLLSTMSELISHDHPVIGVIIGLFGVVIPLVKIVLSLLSLVLTSEKDKECLLNINSLLSKWSMSDVFVMAIMVAFLMVNANEQSIGAVQLHATLESGFYFFLGYCLLAIAASQLLERQQANKP